MQNKISSLIFFAEAQFIFMSAANKDSAKQNKLAFFAEVQFIFMSAANKDSASDYFCNVNTKLSP